MTKKWNSYLGTCTVSLEVLTTESNRWDEFADRLLADGRCDGDHRYAKQIMNEMGNIDIPASIEFFEEHGGYCDCEILLNVDPDGRIWGGTPDDTEAVQ
jgi:Protein of unknown function (DUF2695)